VSKGYALLSYCVAKAKEGRRRELRRKISLNGEELTEYHLEKEN